jgi:hypothetical protein
MSRQFVCRRSKRNFVSCSVVTCEERWLPIKNILTEMCNRFQGVTCTYDLTVIVGVELPSRCLSY